MADVDNKSMAEVENKSVADVENKSMTEADTKHVAETDSIGAIAPNYKAKKKRLSHIIILTSNNEVNSSANETPAQKHHNTKHSHIVH